MCILLFICSQSFNPALSYPVNAASIDKESGTREPIEIEFEILETIERNVSPFTQGLEIYDNHLYESSGLYGESTLRIYNLDSGEAIVSQKLSDDVFGEGLTIHDNQLYILTWREGIVLIHDTNLKPIRMESIEGEGWGICSTGMELITSNGSSTISFRNPSNLEVNHTLEVTLSGEPLDRLNELECVVGSAKLSATILNDSFDAQYAILGLVLFAILGPLAGSALRTNLEPKGIQAPDSNDPQGGA